MTDAQARIIAIAENSAIARYHWLDRGLPPAGYIEGMAVAYARAYCKLKASDADANETAKADTGNGHRDALTWYREVFDAAGMRNGASGADTLRHVFVLLIGLGMRESSGRYCEGRDQSADNTTADTAGAGLFQTSYNAHLYSPLLPPLIARYAGSTDLVDIFHEGVHPRPSDLENYGTGAGEDFQQLTKACPAFAVEFAAIALRNGRTHWGPINTRKAEVRGDSDAMLKAVQDAVDQFELCPTIA